VQGALGNIDTHGAVGATARLGWNLPRSFGVASGPRQRLLPGCGRGDDEPDSVYLYGDIEGRLVLRNLFLDGNTFHDSQSVDKEPLVGTVRVGIAWESGEWRLGYACTLRSKEFDEQPAAQRSGSIVISWTPRP
jgi:hypothetical protein